MFERIMRGGTVDTSELRAFNATLRNARRIAKSNVAYPRQGQSYVGIDPSQYEPLVTQSIQRTMDSADFGEENITFWNLLKEAGCVTDVTSPLHEASRTNLHGDPYLDSFFAEGGVTQITSPEYERQIVQVKYMAKHLQMSDVAGLANSLGVNGNTLSQITMNGMMSLMGDVEKYLFTGNSSHNPLQFDGLRKQIEDRAPDNVYDAGGAQFTQQDAQEVLAEMYGQGRWANPNKCLTSERVLQLWSNIATSHGRHDQTGGQKNPNFGYQGITIGGYRGPVDVVPCTKMSEERYPNKVAGGDSSVAPAVDGANSGNFASAASTAATADAGSYNIKIVAVGDKGYSAPVDYAVVGLAAGEGVAIEILDSGAATEAVRYYRLYMTKVGKTLTTDTHFYVGSFTRDNLGVGLGTRIEYVFDKRADTEDIYILEAKPSVINWVQFADMFRRPLAQTTTVQPFMLVLMGALFLKLPRKAYLIKNAGVTL